MRPILITPTVGVPSFPRVSGDAPVTDAATDFIRWFSPRERGCAGEAWGGDEAFLVFPA